MKALWPATGAPRWRVDAIDGHLAYRSVPPPRTLFVGVKKLAPGTAIHIGKDRWIKDDVYWALPAAAPAASGPLSAFAATRTGAAAWQAANVSTQTTMVRMELAGTTSSVRPFTARLDQNGRPTLKWSAERRSSGSGSGFTP